MVKKNFTNLPTISVITATLNAESVLEFELKSIRSQNYPENKVEIIIADGGSSDNTLKIAKKYKAKIVSNQFKTGEAGKAVGVKRASGELLAFIDSDNILPKNDWLRLMVEPFQDKTIIASEPIEYTYRKQDPWLTRYFALLGMNDPLCLFTGNYDRLCILTGRWTDLKIETQDKGNYFKIKLDKLPFPTIGANGFIVRKKILNEVDYGDYLVDIDVLISLSKQKGYLQIAKVKTGIVHTFVEDKPRKFFTKQLRRINDFSYHRSKAGRAIDWQNEFFWKIIWFQVQCLLIFPILYQTLKGYTKKPDIAWLFHPIACYSTWLIYLYGYIKGKLNPAESSRDKWKQ